jgi:hypothetical protein
MEISKNIFKLLERKFVTEISGSPHFLLEKYSGSDLKKIHFIEVMCLKWFAVTHERKAVMMSTLKSTPPFV